MGFEKRTPIDELTEKINGCAFKVHTALGPGFLEKVYENALVSEMRKAGLHIRQQVPYPVKYLDITVGQYIADLVVEGAVIIEVKTCSALGPAHRAQCINYLKASGLSVALLLNFGTQRLEIRRAIRSHLDLVVGKPPPTQDLADHTFPTDTP